MRRPPLPRATVALHCAECGAVLAELDVNTGQLASVLFQLRREHAIAAHGWLPMQVG